MVRTTSYTLQVADIITYICLIIPFIAWYTVYDSTTIDDSVFWKTDLFYGLLLSAIAIVLSVVHRHSKTPIVLSGLFFGMTLITVVFAPLHKAWLGGIIGDVEYPIYGILFLGITPIYVKAILHVHTKNPLILPLLLSVLAIVRGVMLAVFDDTLVDNTDYDATSIYATLVAIIAFTHNWKPAPRWIKSGIALGIIACVYSIINLDNRTAQYGLIYVSGVCAVWLYAVHFVIKSEKYKHIIYALTPIVAMMGLTVVILGIKLSGDYSGTLWVRGAFLQQILSAVTLKDIVFGNGWGQAYTHIQDSIWVTGVDITSQNTQSDVKNILVGGMGFSHSHNNIFESLLSMGVFGFIFYVGVWIYLAWCLRHRIWVLSIFTGYAVLNTVWFHVSIDMGVIAVMMAGIVANTAVINRPVIKPIYIKIGETINGGILGIVLAFYAIVYVPYIHSLNAKQMPETVFNDQWYNGTATGLDLEIFIWRSHLLAVNKAFEAGKMPAGWAITKFVDIIDTLKNKANNGNRYAIKELLIAYDIVFRSEAQNHPVLEAIRQREYEYWATAVLWANAQFNNRPDLFEGYLLWHLDRGFHTAIMEVTNRLLAKQPDNAVAQYWRAVSLQKQGRIVESQDMFKKAFKNNVVRYQVVNDNDYEKYKHLVDPIYMN